MVMKNGRLYTLDDLIEPYADHAQNEPGMATPWAALGSSQESPTMALAGASGPSFGDTVGYGDDEHC